MFVVERLFGSLWVPVQIYATERFATVAQSDLEYRRGRAARIVRDAGVPETMRQYCRRMTSAAVEPMTFERWIALTLLSVGMLVLGWCVGMALFAFIHPGSYVLG